MAVGIALRQQVAQMGIAAPKSTAWKVTAGMACTIVLMFAFGLTVAWHNNDAAGLKAPFASAMMLLFLPTCIALFLNHRHVLAICLLNVLFFLMMAIERPRLALLIWLAATVWSFIASRKPRATLRQKVALMGITAPKSTAWKVTAGIACATILVLVGVPTIILAWDTGSARALYWIPIALAIFMPPFLPTWIALFLNHRYAPAVFLVNILMFVFLMAAPREWLGLLPLIWLAAAVWSFITGRKPPAVAETDDGVEAGVAAAREEPQIA